MKRARLPIRIATFLVLTSAGLTAFAAGYPANPEDLRGMASLICSGVLVRVNRGSEQPAVLLTNGHCATNKSIATDDALVNVPYERGEISLYFGGETSVAVTPARVLYATRTGTDIALIELKSTYGELEAKGAKVYEVSDVDAKPTTDIQLVSGFWKEKNLCAISHIVPNLVEDVWTTRDSYALKDPCPTQGGWSGTPMIDPTTQKIVGILNTTNVAGQLCTLDNPCEVDSAGNRLAFNGRTYGQRTSPIVDCFDRNGEFKLSAAACHLTKPKIRTQSPKPENKPSPSPTSKPEKAPTSKWPKSRRN